MHIISGEAKSMLLRAKKLGHNLRMFAIPSEFLVLYQCKLCGQIASVKKIKGRCCSESVVFMTCCEEKEVFVQNKAVR